MALNGGKAYLAERIVSLMPAHTHYIEPYGGGLAVLLAKPHEGISEVVNDLHRDLTTFWKVLQGKESFADFQRICEATPFSQLEWNDAALAIRAGDEKDDPVIRAWRFFVHCRMSLAGRMDGFAPLSRNRTRRGMNEQASAWLGAVDGLPLIHHRLKRVVILCEPATDVIRKQDGESTLFYLDPPYVHEARASKSVYHHEITRLDHIALLTSIRHIKAKIMLSGYPSDLYEQYLGDWNRHTFDLPNHSAGGSSKRRMTECLWTNF